MPEVGVRVPQALPDVVKFTGSPATAAPDEVVTVATTDEVLVPLAGSDAGLAVTDTAAGVVDGGVVCVTVVLPAVPVEGVAVMVQKPAAVADV